MLHQVRDYLSGFVSDQFVDCVLILGLAVVSIVLWSLHAWSARYLTRLIWGPKVPPEQSPAFAKLSASLNKPGWDHTTESIFLDKLSVFMSGKFTGDIVLEGQNIRELLTPKEHSLFMRMATTKLESLCREAQTEREAMKAAQEKTRMDKLAHHFNTHL